MPPSPLTAEAIAARLVRRRPLPHVLHDLLALREDDPASAARLSALVLADPDLSRRMRSLGAQNPRLQSDEQRNVNAAMQRLGYRQIHCAAVGVVLMDVLAASLGALDFVAYWRRAAVVASLAAGLATHDRSDARDLAYAAGMLHQVGLLAIDSEAPELLAALADAVVHAGGAATEAAEERVLGFTVREATVALVSGWGLPLQLGEALLVRDEPELRAERPLARALWQAVAAADALGVEDPLTGPAVARRLDREAASVIRQYFGGERQLVGMAEGALGLWMLGQGGAA